MTAASYWSLLAPAIEMAEHSGIYGADGQWAFVPVAVGFAVGALFVYGADILMPDMGDGSTKLALSLELDTKAEDRNQPSRTAANRGLQDEVKTPRLVNEGDRQLKHRGHYSPSKQQKQEDNHMLSPRSSSSSSVRKDEEERRKHSSWRRILLLIIAITIHNIPEGLAVGVGFGAVGKSKAATFENARNLAIGIGIQNFPEGLAVSLPLRGSGISLWKSFWYGQLSGLVEPMAGLFGVMAVAVAEPILPYALAFAAGAMIYVVMDDIVPEAQNCGNGKLASWGAVVGFIVMMSLDVGLG